MGLKDLLKMIPNDVTGDGKRFAAALKLVLQKFSLEMDTQVKDVVEGLVVIPEQVTGLKLTERHTTDSNGMPQNDVLVEYDNANVADFSSAQIWVKEAEGEYQLFGSSGGVKYTVTGVTTGKTYSVKVVAVNKQGNGADFEEAPQANITIKGSVLVPEVPKQFVLTWDEEGPLWEWLHEDNGYVDFFELRLDANAGTYSDKLLDRTRDFKSRANPKVRSGTAYLFVRNIFGTYSVAAEHQFGKEIGAQPDEPVLSATLDGVNIYMEPLPEGFTGYKLIINGEEFTSRNNEFVYFLFGGSITVKYCFVDDIGDGAYSEEVTDDVERLIEASDIAEGAVGETKIAANAVTAAKIQANAITADKIAASSITTEKVADKSITGVKIEDGAITATKIEDGAVSTTKIEGGAITTKHIQAGSIIGEHISAGAVTTEKIAAGAITAQQIAANAINAETLGVTELSAITAIIGELKTSDSGARMVIKDNLIEIYDDNDVLRVRMGVWG